MKKVSLFFVIVFSAFALGSPLMAEGSALVCIDGRPFVKKGHFERGCSHGSEPFYTSLLLNAETIDGGTIDLSIDWTFEYADPRCDNPRGQYVVRHLPLPIYAGIWDVFEDGETLGKVSFQTILPCRIQGNGPVLD